MVKKKSSKKDYLSPEEASEIVENGSPYKVPQENGNGGHIDKAAKEAQLLGSTKEAIALRKAEIDGEIKLSRAKWKAQIDTIEAQKTAKEVAGIHLAKFGALYLCLMVLAFLGSVTFIPGDNLAIVATLITLVVTSLSAILKGISDTPEPKDPVELMHDIVQKQLSTYHDEETHSTK
tara:strand:+ start:14858 stop:15388 length:531 start_codon:yes stop_codon:yes gene_type:complete